MDPRMTLFESMRAVVTQLKLGRPSEHQQRVTEAFEEVGLDDSFPRPLPRWPAPAVSCSGW